MLTDCEKLENDSPGGSSCLVACRMLIRSSLDEFTASHAIPLSRGDGLQYTNCRCSIVSDSESKQVIACEERKEVRVFESFRIKKQGDIISCRLHTKINGEFVLTASLLWKTNELMNTSARLVNNNSYVTIFQLQNDQPRLDSYRCRMSSKSLVFDSESIVASMDVRSKACAFCVQCLFIVVLVIIYY